jgi:hypothetical protein
MIWHGDEIQNNANQYHADWTDMQCLPGRLLFRGDRSRNTIPGLFCLEKTVQHGVFRGFKLNNSYFGMAA